MSTKKTSSKRTSRKSVIVLKDDAKGISTKSDQKGSADIDLLLLFIESASSSDKISATITKDDKTLSDKELEEDQKLFNPNDCCYRWCKPYRELTEADVEEYICFGANCLRLIK